MDEQRTRSEFQGSGEVAVEGVFQAIADRVGATKFLGYEATEPARRRSSRWSPTARRPDAVGPFSKNVAVVTAETPFYGEQGGQMGDTGTLSSAPGASMTVRDASARCRRCGSTSARCETGELRVGDTVELTVDAERRDAIRRNHSATHLLHWALRHVLGEHVTQKGSLVAPDRLRFDFSHFAPLTRRREAEGRGSGQRARARATPPPTPPCCPSPRPSRRARSRSSARSTATRVRVVTMGESKEFCGGTHVARTGDIAFFKITEETGVAQGVRRIEAVTGAGALGYVRRLEGELGEAGELLRAGNFEIAARVAKLQAELRERDKEIEKLRRKLASGGGRDLASEARDVGGVRVLATRVDVADSEGAARGRRPAARQAALGRDRAGGRRGRQDRAGGDGDARSRGASSTPARSSARWRRRSAARAAGAPTWRRGAAREPQHLDAALARVFDLVRG